MSSLSNLTHSSTLGLAHNRCSINAFAGWTGSGSWKDVEAISEKRRWSLGEERALGSNSGSLRLTWLGHLLYLSGPQFPYL